VSDPDLWILMQHEESHESESPEFDEETWKFPENLICRDVHLQPWALDMSKSKVP
jgi:hypothetical protein